MSEKALYRHLGRAVAARRNELTLSQDQVAAKLGLSRASIANLENGRQRIMVHQLFRLVDALNLKSILDLVPATWTFEAELPEINIQLSPKEHSTVHSMLTSVFVDDRRRKRSV